MKIDVAVCTYQSGKYLDECLTSIEKAIPLNKLIIIDHHSTDKTIEIARKHHTEIHFENMGLGYARQLGINLVETPIFMFVDSDVVFHDYDWFPKAVSLINEKHKIGAVGVYTPPRHTPSRQKYADFWWKKIPSLRKIGFVNAYLILKKAIEDIKIPDVLGSYEHVYIMRYMQKCGWKYAVINVNGIHYYDYPETKGAWLGAGNRLLFGLKDFPHFLIRRVLTSPLKAIPPAIATNDPDVILWNTRYWLSYLKGWLHPKDYTKMKR